MRTEASPRPGGGFSLRPALLASVALLFAALACVAPARAEDLPPAVRALLDAMGLQLNVRPKVGGVRELEDGYELRDVVFLEAKTDDGAPLVSLRARRLRVTGAAQRDGLFVYGHVRLEDTLFEAPLRNDPNRRMRLEIPALDIVEASVLPESEARNDLEKLASARLVASAISMPQATIALPETTIQWSGLKATWKGDRRKGTGISDADFGEIVIPLKDAALAGARRGVRSVQTLERLGLERLTITGRSHQEVTIRPDGRMHSTSDLRIGAREAGFLNIGVDDVSFPVAMLGQLKEYVEKWRGDGAGGMFGNPGRPGIPRPGYNPLSDPMLMNFISQVTLRGLSLKWEDRGITRKLLEFTAEREGKTVEALVRERLQKAQVVLAAFLPPELLEKSLNALMSYLREPKNIRITVTGANGQYVALPALASAFISPQALFSLLEIDIAANE